MSEAFTQASRRLLLLICVLSACVLSACGGGSSEPSLQTSSSSEPTAQETWSSAEPSASASATESSYLFWTGTPETPPTPDPGYVVPTSSWWLQDSQTGAYLPGLRQLQAFSSSSFLAGKSTLYLVKDGQIFQVDLTQGPSWQPVQVSSIKDAASIEDAFTDSSGETVLRVRTFAGSLAVVKPNTARNDAPQAVAVSNIYELHAFKDANGRLQGRLVIDRDKWELALLSDDETRVLQHFALPDELDRSAIPAKWIGPQWHAHAGVLQIGQDLYRFDWRGPIAMLSNSLYRLQQVDTYTRNHRYVADDMRLYVQDGWNIISIGPSGPVQHVTFEHDVNASPEGGIGDMMLIKQALVVLYSQGASDAHPAVSQIRIMDRQTLATKEDIAPTSSNRRIGRLIWSDDQSIGFTESMEGPRHLVRWTFDHQYTFLANNPYIFEQPFNSTAIAHSERGWSHQPDVIADWYAQHPYVTDWGESSKYLSMEPASQIWWCDSSENGHIRRNCDPTSPIKRYDIQAQQLTQQGKWPEDAHITQVAISSSGLAFVVDSDLVGMNWDSSSTSFRFGLWRFDTVGDKAPFFLSAQIQDPFPKASPAAPTPAAASSLTSQSKSE